MRDEVKPAPSHEVKVTVIRNEVTLATKDEVKDRVSVHIRVKVYRSQSRHLGACAYHIFLFYAASTQVMVNSRHSGRISTAHAIRQHRQKHG